MSTNSEPPADRGGRDDDLQRLSMTIPMAPDMSNCAGTVHGGLLLTYLDQVAYTCATRWARTYAVTLSVDQVVSREPVHVGELATFQAGVNRTGRTSMEIGVRVTTEDLVSRVVRHSSSCYFTRVAIGPDGRPVEVPPWRPRTSVERRRHEAAGRRRELRREIERATTEIRAAVHALTRTPRPGSRCRRSGAVQLPHMTTIAVYSAPFVAVRLVPYPIWPASTDLCGPQWTRGRRLGSRAKVSRLVRCQ